MASKNIELRVGLLVLTGIAIVVFSVWLAKGYRYGQQFNSVSVVFPEVGALSSGDPVKVSGVTKGKVIRIGLYDGGVLVEFDLAADVILKKDASFMVKNIGLMGERFLAVKTGKSEEVLDMSTPPSGGFDAGIPEVMGMMGDVIQQLNSLVNALSKTIASPETLDKFSKTVDDLKTIASRLEASTARNIPRIDSAAVNIADLSRTLKRGLDRNQPYLDNGLRNFDSASTQLLEIVGTMEEASLKLKSFATDLDESEGSMRLLMEDRRLYDDLRATAGNLDSLVNDIRQNPKKYINFTVEIF